MFSLTFIFKNETTGEVLSEQVRTIELANGPRLIAAYAYSYRDKFTNEDGTPRVPTNAEVHGAWVDGIVAGSLANVLSVEKEQAATAAAAAVTAISVS